MQDSGRGVAKLHEGVDRGATLSKMFADKIGGQLARLGKKVADNMDKIQDAAANLVSHAPPGVCHDASVGRPDSLLRA